MAFVHFGIHSEFSINDSIIRIKALVKAAAADAMPALALTDHANLYATVKFYQACLGAGIKPIIGSEVLLDESAQNDKPHEKSSSKVTLLAADNTGYKHLTEVVSLGFTQGKLADENAGLVQHSAIFEKNTGMIALLGQHSDVGKALLSSNPERAIALTKAWLAAFTGRLYFAISRTNRADEDRYIQQIIWLCETLATENIFIPVIAHNDVRFLAAEDFEAHEARVCIATKYVLADQKRPKNYSNQQFFKTQAQMAAQFADIPVVVKNTIELAKRCNVTIEIGKNYLPEYPIPQGDTIETFFTRISYEGLDNRLNHLYPTTERENPEKTKGKPWAELEKEYKDRLQYELDIICQMGFPGYFIIVMDFIRWAKENDVPVGPGRGSGAGSLVAYSLDITDLDPLAYDLLFERFLNPERVSMPDFDIDFCIAGRDRVIEYVAHTYGRDAVSQIITFGTMAAKAVVRDVARVQGKSYGLADKISKLIPSTPGISLAEAEEQEPQLKDLLHNPNNMDYEDATEIWEMALKLEGVTRNVGKHAGGVLIAPGKITDFTAIYCDDDGHRTSQFDKDDVEKVGLVKFDFLGLKNLTVIDAAVKSVNASRAKAGQAPLVLSQLPLDDAATYAMLQDAKSTAVFQLESAGMKKYLKKLQPSNIDDVIAMCALYRPGPLDAGMVEMYIERKHGREEVLYDHPDLKEILQPTYGVIVYQEQVMQISQVMAGYTLGGADMLRRAMGKKKPEEMAKQRITFVDGAKEKGIDDSVAGGVFDLMEKFAGYGFNKSHSAAYGIIAYQTAYLKCHYPAEFMAEVLTADSQNTDSVVFFIDDCRQCGVAVIPPSVNESDYRFVAKDAETIVYGLGAIKGVGESAVLSIMEARQQDGAFKDLFDFCHRVDLKKVSKLCLEALIKAGAFDCLSHTTPAENARAAFWEQLPEAVQAAEQARKNAEYGMMDLFGDVTEAQKAPPLRPIVWSDSERLKGEKDKLGLYLTGHPLDAYRDEIKQLCSKSIAQLEQTKRGESVLFAGLVIDVANFPNRTVVTLDDGTARLEVSCYPERFELFRSTVKVNSIVVLDAEISVREGFEKPMGRLKGAKTLEQMRAERISHVEIHQHTHKSDDDSTDNHTQDVAMFLDSLQTLFASQADFKENHQKQQLHLLESQKTELHHSPIHIKMHTFYATSVIKLGENHQFIPENSLIEQLFTLFGKENVGLIYK